MLARARASRPYDWLAREYIGSSISQRFVSDYDRAISQ
jgi:hypothetical protein